MLSGEVLGTGARISFDEIRIDRFSDRKIVESWFIRDQLTLWQQLGLIPAST
jgi:predicted ester cyclase